MSNQSRNNFSSRGGDEFRSTSSHYGDSARPELRSQVARSTLPPAPDIIRNSRTLSQKFVASMSTAHRYLRYNVAGPIAEQLFHTGDGVCAPVLVRGALVLVSELVGGFPDSLKYFTQ